MTGNESPPQPSCGARHPQKDWLRCTLPQGHQGRHEAEDTRGTVHGAWNNKGDQ